ncbi:MAG TPA: hypothetical protein VH591_22420 [Ktedonobacterales bacterium]
MSSHPARPTLPPAYSEGVCIGHKPLNFVHYYSTCTGHDEPELDPVSNAPGSARDLTWILKLPTDGSIDVDAVGPTFWTGRTVSDSNSLLGQAFLELQFYPNSHVEDCTPDGGYDVTYARNDYSACSPVWKVDSNFDEVAAFNAMLRDRRTGKAMIMHAGDLIAIHQFVTPAKDGMHIFVFDATTGRDGSIVLNSADDGPLMPAYDKQQIGNALGWGIVNDTPNSFVWEIGHTGNFTDPPGDFCLPGSATNPPCYSYNVPSWLKFSPLQIKGVVFGLSTKPSEWAVVSDYGGRAEVDQYCGASNYGTPFCTYPWYAFNGRDQAFTYGGDYPGTTRDFGKVNQFQQTTNCGGPFGADSTYCVTPIHADVP